MKQILLMCLVLLLQACAFTDVTLDIREDQEASFKGPISSINQIEFSYPELVDNRDDLARIGWVTNGYGAKTADIYSSEPVTTVVSNAVKSALMSNGHSIGEVGKITISGQVKQFWFETDVNFWTVEFIGTIEASLKFTDNTSNETLYESVYNGSYSEKVGGGYKKTWQKVMGKALDNLIEDIVFDTELVEALEGVVDSDELASISLNLSE